jgi:branched-chain amino acid aminotransferase
MHESSLDKSLPTEIVVFFNNQFVPISEAKVGILTHALHYGTGVFEGIRGYWDEASSELFLVRAREHYERWKTNARILRIGIHPGAEGLCGITRELCVRNGFRTDVYVRPLAYKSAERIGVNPDSQDAFAIVALPFGEYLDSRKGLHAGVVSWRRIEDCAIPGRAKICGAYVNSALAGDEARRNGFDEAIFLTESGHVAEGASCNFFMVRRGKLVTPPVSDNILEGITRDSILELASRELRMETVERSIDRSELYTAEEAFFTGTAVGVAPIVWIDRRSVGRGEIGTVTARLRGLYVEATRGRLPAYRKWVAPVYGRSMGSQAA